MTEINYLSTLAYVKADMAKDRMITSLKEFRDDESGVDGIVVAVILIAIAVLGGIVFREALFGDGSEENRGLIGDMLHTIQEWFEQNFHP